MDAVVSKLGEAAVFPNGGNTTRQVSSLGVTPIPGSAVAKRQLTNVIEEGEGASLLLSLVPGPSVGAKDAKDCHPGSGAKCHHRFWLHKDARHFAHNLAVPLPRKESCHDDCTK
jgi:hypothetical protein